MSSQQSGSAGGRWEALPPRKRNRQRGGSSAVAQEVDNGQDGEEIDENKRNSVDKETDSSSHREHPESADSSSNSSNNASGGGSSSKDSSKASAYQNIESRTNTINDNIANRSKIVRAAATLEHKDGCAGEFFEYLDHTADVQFHVWGDSLKHTFENIAVCMFNYITDISLVEDKFSIEYRVDGHDMQSLLFEYMEELLFRFSTEGFMCKWVEIDFDDFDKGTFSFNIKCHGCKFDPTIHVQGTEIKACTYSNMQIHDNKETNRCDIYVIVDI